MSLASFTARFCGSSTVPDKFTVFTCAALGGVAARIITQISNTALTSLRTPIGSPPSRKFHVELRTARPHSYAVAKRQSGFRSVPRRAATDERLLRPRVTLCNKNSLMC